MEDKDRPYWQGLLQDDTTGLIFVVDSNDRRKISQAKDELYNMLDKLPGNKAPLLVIANKQDLANAMSGDEVANTLGLSQVYDRPWYLQDASGTSGDGLYEGMDWLAKNVNTK